MEQSDLDLLQLVPLYHLQAVVKTRRIPVPLKTQVGDTPSSPSTPANLAEIARFLFDEEMLTPLLTEMNKVEIAILQELISCGGRANSRDLALYLSQAGIFPSPQRLDPSPAHEPLGVLTENPARSAGPFLPPQYPVPYPHGSFEQAVRHLLSLGLLFWGRQTNFAGRDYTSGIHDGVLIVPYAVQTALLSFWDAEEHTLARTSSLSYDVGDGARSLQRHLYLYWSFVASQREGLALLGNGLLTRASLRALLEHLPLTSSGEQVRLETDLPHLLFLRQLLIQLGLLHERRSFLYATDAEPFFSQPLLTRARLCFHFYKEDSFWNEMLFLPEVNVRPGPAPLESAQEEVVHARQIVLERLLREPAEEWNEITTLIARTKIHAPYLLFPRQYGPRAERYSSGSNPYGWDFRLRRGWLTHREGWHMVEGGFIRTILSGPLYWLGIVELNREENPTSFRLLPTAMTLMSEQTPVDDEQSWGRLIVQPNFELVALAPVSELLLVRLDHFAERVSLELIAQYRLTKASVTRAIQHGLHAEQIQQELEQATGGDIPQNVRYSLLEWERQARRVELWQHSTLLEVAEPSLLDQLFADASLRPFLGRRLSPLIAEVLPGHLETLQNLLWSQDFLPALTSAHDTFLPPEESVVPTICGEPQWHLLPNGLLQPIYNVLNLYLVAEAERFCERDIDTGWLRLSQISLQKALEQGLELDIILAFLERFSEAGIPGSLKIRLKLWGAGYGAQSQVYVEKAPLLRLSAQVLQDVLADPEMSALLGTEVEQPSRLIRVEPENLERVLELLRDRGFATE
jgi:Helicase conserved C-terminal domain